MDSENCREQHLKCDRVTPTCGRCLAARRECRRAGLKIRVVKKDFKKKQKWVKTPRRAVFVDETKKVISGLGSQDDDLDDNDSVSDSPVPSTDATPAAPSETYTPEMTMTALAAATSIVSPGPAQNGSPTDRASHRPDLHWIRKPELRRIMESIYLTKLMYPLTDITTANLLRHYIQSLAKWLDLCDKDRWFETIVPKIAGTNKVLMHAIFALASRHMHHIGNDIDALSSERYYDSCSELLRSALIYNETVSDSNLFAATIILRVWEEMGGKLHIQQGLTLEHRLTTVAVAVTHHGEDCEGYILTIHHFVKMGGQHLAPRTLGAAAFWVGLRQEIFVAVIKKEPIRILLVPSLVNPVLPLEDRQRSHIGQLEIYGEEDEADDYTLANRAVVHCAEVLNHCFSKTDVPGSQWHKLKDKIDKWKTHLPDTYRPIFCGRDANEPFSEEWYSQSCHVIGWQHHLLAELFLVRKDPSLPPQMALKVSILESEDTIQL
ncbi:hypothetical protein OQA88_5607 [Cercophora sp. LCS_1]